jgi:hypothetical protein
VFEKCYIACGLLVVNLAVPEAYDTGLASPFQGNMDVRRWGVLLVFKKCYFCWNCFFYNDFCLNMQLRAYLVHCPRIPNVFVCCGLTSDMLRFFSEEQKHVKVQTTSYKHTTVVTHDDLTSPKNISYLKI